MATWVAGPQAGPELVRKGSGAKSTLLPGNEDIRGRAQSGLSSTGGFPAFSKTNLPGDSLSKGLTSPRLALEFTALGTPL